MTEPSASGATDSDAGKAGYAVWGRRDDGTPIRWDPCQPIRVAVNDHHAPPGWRDDLSEALRRISDATVITFDVSATDEPPSLQRAWTVVAADGTIEWAPVLIAWSSPNDHDSLQAWDRAVAIPVAVGPPGLQVFVTGQVVFNRDRDASHHTDGGSSPYGPALHTGWEDRSSSWGAVILHELGHLLGLDHVDNPEELMSATPGHGPVTLGPGDRAGLHAVAGNRACLDVPAAALVRAQRR